jgi:hypothetical protein
MTIVGVLAATTPETTDYLCFWAGPHLILTGGDPYAQADWNRVTAGEWVDALGRFRTSNCSDRFAYPYPLTTAVAMLPFGALPMRVGAPLWELTIFISAGVGLLLLARAAELDRARTLWLALFVISSEMFYGNVLNAQFGGLALLALGLLVAAPRLSPARATAGIALAALKPHVITPVPIVRLRAMDRSAVFSAALFGLLWFAASLTLRPAWLAGWAADLAHRRDMFGSSVSLWTLERTLNAPGLALAVIAPTVAFLALACWRARPLRVIESTAIVVVAWQLVVPYGLSYDQLGAIAVAMTAVLRTTVGRPHAWRPLVPLVAVVTVLPWFLFSQGKVMIGGRAGELEVLNAIVPVATCVLLAVAILTSARPVSKREAVPTRSVSHR